jgi:crossover junction endodeoxyribonuclease RuvC
MQTIVAVDPGLSGAIAFLTGDALTVHDMPTLASGKDSRKEIDLAALATLLDRDDLAHAFVERVGAMPGQGVTSMFRFGHAVGVIHGMLGLARVPITLVTPQSWKRAMGVPAAKDGARARASQLMPQHAANWPRVKDDGRAEAAMIALWGARELGRVAA